MLLISKLPTWPPVEHKCIRDLWHRMSVLTTRNCDDGASVGRVWIGAWSRLDPRDDHLVKKPCDAPVFRDEQVRDLRSTSMVGGMI